MSSSRIRTSIETEFEAGGHRVRGRIENVSGEGLFVGTSSIPEVGENVAIDFRTPDGGAVRLSGMVWWTTDEGRGARHPRPGFGLRLLEENDEFRLFLDRLRQSAGSRSFRSRAPTC